MVRLVSTRPNFQRCRIISSADPDCFASSSGPGLLQWAGAWVSAQLLGRPSSEHWKTDDAGPDWPDFCKHEDMFVTLTFCKTAAIWMDLLFFFLLLLIIISVGSTSHCRCRRICFMFFQVQSRLPNIGLYSKATFQAVESTPHFDRSSLLLASVSLC